MSVSSSVFDRNFFDGIALYASRDVQIAGFRQANGAAGLSLDNELSDVQFANGRIEGNGDVGIFARDSADLSFYDLVISSTGATAASFRTRRRAMGQG